MTMTYGEAISAIRKLAKTDYWQTLYSQSKDVGGIQIFRNHTDFTDLQVTFLNNLGFYASLYFDIAMGEVTDIVLDNEVYEDAYAYWRYKKRMDKTKQRKASPQAMQTPFAQPGPNGSETVVNKNEFVFTKTKGGRVKT